MAYADPPWRCLEPLGQERLKRKVDKEVVHNCMGFYVDVFGLPERVVIFVYESVI